MPQAPFIETKPVPLVNPDLKSDPEMSRGLDAQFANFFDKAPEPTAEEVAEAEAAPPPEEPPETEYATDEDAPELPKPKAEKAPKVEKKDEKKPEAKKLEEKPKGPVKEEKKEAPKVEAKPEAKAEAKAELKGEAEEEADPELDALQPDPNSRPENRTGFQVLKAKAKGYKSQAHKTKAELESIRKEVEARDKQLEELRKAPVPPEIQKELEATRKRAADAEHRARLVDLENDRQFKSEYDDKITAFYHEILDDCVRLKGNSPEIRQWADHLKANVSPYKLDREWWKKGVVNAFEDEDDRSEKNEQAKQLLSLMKVREKKLEEFKKDPDKLQKYNQERYQTYWNDIYIPRVKQHALDTAPKILGGWGVQKDPAQAKTDEEKAEVVEHNKTYQVLYDAMQDVISKINDPSETRPQSHAVVALQAVKAIKLQQDVERLTKELEGKSTTLKTTEETMKAELEASKAEVERLQGELDKVTKARSAVAKGGNAPNKPPGKGMTAKLNQSSHDAINEFFANR
jgi:hypothetical protein